jgi:predicted ATPase
MTPEKISRVQGYLMIFGVASSLAGMTAKAQLAYDRSISAYSELGYFIANFSHATIWVYVHWFGTALFLSAIVIAGILERIKTKK